jgi:hypothetical protein
MNTFRELGKTAQYFYKQAFYFYKPLRIFCHTLKYEILSKLLVPIGQLTFHAKKFSLHCFQRFFAAVAWLTARLTPSGKKKSNHFFSSPNFALFSFLFLLQISRYFHFFFYYKCRVIFISFSVPNATLFSFLFLFQNPRYFNFFFCSKVRFLLVSFHISYVLIFLLLFV